VAALEIVGSPVLRAPPVRIVGPDGDAMQRIIQAVQFLPDIKLGREEIRNRADSGPFKDAVTSVLSEESHLAIRRPLFFSSSPLAFSSFLMLSRI